jgi:hypothetical protein
LRNNFFTIDYGIVAYLYFLQVKVNALRELQSQTQEELGALLQSVLDRAFKGEL